VQALDLALTNSLLELLVEPFRALALAQSPAFK
jgi:hypothetical protein